MQRGGLSQVAVPVLVSSNGFLLFIVVDAATTNRNKSIGRGSTRPWEASMRGRACAAPRASRLCSRQGITLPRPRAHRR